MKPWVIDAGTGEFTTDELLRYTPISNQAVKSFLSPKNTKQTVLVAPKGYGKTLLLLKKAAALRSMYGEEQAYIHPSNAAKTLEFMRIDGMAQKITDWQWSKRFSSHQDWSDIWMYAIGFMVCRNEGRRPSASANAIDVANQIERLFGSGEEIFRPNKTDESKTSKTRKTSGRRKNDTPYEISTVRNFISSMLQNWETHADSYCALYTRVAQRALDELSHLHILFLDSPDEALNWDKDDEMLKPTETEGENLWSSYPEHWVNFNMGLVDAIRRLGQMYGKIRVFTSLRAEALNSVNAAVADQYEEICIRLSYNKAELRQIFESNIELMAQSDEFREKLVTPVLTDHLVKDFVGIARGLHEPTGLEEDIFDRILRHTRWTPRDLMFVGRNIMEKITVEDRGRCTPQSLDPIRKVIDDASRRFLKNHQDASIPQWAPGLNEQIAKFRTNIIHSISLRILSPLSRRSSVGGCPFDYLYSQGLLGWIGASTAGSALAIQFLEGQEIATKGKQLPAARWYAFHPIFYGFLRDTHGSYRGINGYLSSDRAIVGNGHLIEPPRVIRGHLTATSARILITGSRILSVDLRDSAATTVLIVLIAHAAANQTLTYDKGGLTKTFEHVRGLCPLLVKIDWDSIFRGSTDETKIINGWLANTVCRMDDVEIGPPISNKAGKAKLRALYPMRLRFDKPYLYFDGIDLEEMALTIKPSSA